MKRKTMTWVRKAEDDWDAACELATRSPPLRDAVCFHCQQSAEKYMKALPGSCYIQYRRKSRVYSNCERILSYLGRK